MAEGKVIKKGRSSRATALQFGKMIDFFLLNKGLAEGRFCALHGKEEAENKWAELAADLNKEIGAYKTPKQWQVVWRDLKSRVSIKARDLRKAKGLTGNNVIDHPELSELDRRVIGITGTEYVEGSTECVESIPEQLNIQRELIQGNTDILMDMSFTSNVHNYSLNDDDDTAIEPLVTSERYASDTQQTDDIGSSTGVSTRISRPNERRNRRNVAPISLSRRFKRAKPSTAARLESATENFQRIAEKQADAMMILAEASKMQAEAAMQNASAMREMSAAALRLADSAAGQSENEKDRLKIMDRFLSVLENILPTYASQ